MNQKLKGSIGVLTGAAYCVTIIIGAGILALPGEAFRIAGPQSFYAWLFDFLMAIPLLVIFSRMIIRVRSAGGIADFVKFAFGDGPLFLACQLLLLLTLVAGTAAIAIIGAQYLLPQIESFNNSSLVLLSASLVLIILPGLINSFGVKLGGGIQSAWATVLILFLLAAILVTIPDWSTTFAAGSLKFDPASADEIWKAMGLVWFAYTGIEMISFLGEEFESPTKFIFAIVISFVVVGFIYLGLAMAVISSVPENHPRLVDSPLTAILTQKFGDGAATYSAWLGYILILINLNAAIMGASRLIFSIGREAKVLPKIFGALNRHQVPLVSLWALCAAACIVVALSLSGLWTTQSILLLVSQNWFLLYVVAILAFVKIEKNIFFRIFGIVSLLFSTIFMKIFSFYLVIPAVLLVYAYTRRRFRPTHNVGSW